MNGHKLAIGSATVGAIVLIAGMLFGWKYSLRDLLGVDRTAREAAIALWTFLLPAWFLFEEWWAPSDDKPAELAKFRKNQQYARYGWTVVGAVVAILIGLTAPDVQRPNGISGNKGPTPPISSQAR